jgi:isochorismate synthase
MNAVNLITSALEKGTHFAWCRLPGADSSGIRAYYRDGRFISEDGTELWLKPWDDAPGQVRHTILSEDSYLRMIAEAVNDMRNQGWSKVVLSRIVNGPECSFGRLAALYEALCMSYPQAFVYVLSHPHYGIWAGATPETLLRWNGEGMSTMALAGTRKPGTAHWGEKERTEHQIVVDEMLRGLSVFTHAVAGATETIQVGPVEHLRTPISGGPLSDALAAAQALHPTPAVCGLPRQRALEYIRTHEPHRRELYTGVIGMLFPDGSGHLFVNLRCMQLAGGRALIYVGGGITPESNPQSEWQETVLKSGTLLDVLNG